MEPVFSNPSEKNGVFKFTLSNINVSQRMLCAEPC